VLLPNCDRYQVNVTHIIRIMPGEVAQVMQRSLVVGLPEGDRSAAQHDLGVDRLHPRKWGNATRAWVEDLAG
jgi:hypothetical protein